MNAAYPVEMIQAASKDIECEIMAMLLIVARLEGRPTSKRNATIIEEMNTKIAELELDAARLADMELAAEAAEVTEVSPAERSAARAGKRAMRAAKSEKTTIVRGAAAVGRYFEKLAEGCMFKTGDIRTWEIADEEGSYRLTLSPGATSGVLRFTRRTALGY